MLVSDKTKINLIKHLQQNQTNTKSKKKILKKEDNLKNINCVTIKLKIEQFEVRAQGCKL